MQKTNVSVLMRLSGQSKKKKKNRQIGKTWIDPIWDKIPIIYCISYDNINNDNINKHGIEVHA